MRIALVSGSLPPNPCGVGDYTDRLASALTSQGIDVTCIGGEPWRGHRAARDIRRLISNRNLDLVHLQYPTVGFGRSLCPATLPVVAAGVSFAVTLHEFTSLRRARRPWFWSFAHFADLRIFTKERERDAFDRSFCPSRGHDEIIEIGSNIPRAPTRQRDAFSVCYFGLITPGKGIEDFLDLVARTKNGPWRYRMIGAWPTACAPYATKIVERARELDIDLRVGAGEAEVSELLARTEVAYLPFEANASRGSLLAALNNGTVVITRHGPSTSLALKSATVDARSVQVAAKWLTELFVDDGLRDRLRRAAIEIPVGWDSIARAHVSAYEAVISQAGQRRSFALRAEKEACRARLVEDNRSREGMDISVIVATKGRRRETSALLNKLKCQTRLPSRVLVIGTHPSDLDEEGIRQISGFEVRAWIADRAGLTLQRNAGLARLALEGRLHDRSVVIFFDDDFRPAPDWIEKCEALFQHGADVRAMTGHVLADGIHRLALTEAEADAFIGGQVPPRAHWSDGGRREVSSMYGCNMAFLGSVFATCAFDEQLPLYGWQEDRDMTGQVRKIGRALINPCCRGVHLGAGSSRTSDLRFGYSQVANVIYLRRKGTMDSPTTLQFLLRAFASNILNALRGRQQPAYALRLKGNILALGHLLLGHCRPSRILDLR